MKGTTFYKLELIGIFAFLEYRLITLNPLIPFLDLLWISVFLASIVYLCGFALYPLIEWGDADA